MLWVYVPRGKSLDRVAVASEQDVPENSVWFDLVNPNLQEDKIVEHKVGISVPTRGKCRRSKSPAGSTSRTAPVT